MDSNTPENQQQPAKKDKFDPKKPPDRSNPDEVYNYVAKRISGPTFRNPLKNFIDENCITFIDVDENTFEQGQLFKELNQLLENLLDDVLKDGQLTQEDFLQAAAKGVEDKQYKKYFNQVINFGDYNFFKSIMTKRNYQIIKMAEQQMANAKNMPEGKKEEINEYYNNEQSEQKTKELVQKLLEEENKELDEAIKQSLEEEDKRRRIAAIEEEELRRALQKSLINQEENAPPKKEEPEIKKEVKKEEPKKFVPSISNQINFGFEGQVKLPKEEKKQEIKPEIKKEQTILPSSQKGFILESSNANVEISSNPYKKSINKPNPYKNLSIKKEEKPESPKKEEKEEKVIIPKEEIKQKEEIKPKEEINENLIDEDPKPKKEERITRDFINVFEEKKKTLKPLGNIHNIRNDNEGKKGTLLQDLKKKKGNIKEDIERLNIKKENQKKIESATEIIKNKIQKDVKEDNNNDIVNLDDGLLLNDDNIEEDNNKNKYVSKHNIQFGKIEIPSNFSGKIPEYTKEKQEELKEFRDMVIKHKINDREKDENDA